MVAVAVSSVSVCRSRSAVSGTDLGCRSRTACERFTTLALFTKSLTLAEVQSRAQDHKPETPVIPYSI